MRFHKWIALEVMSEAGGSPCTAWQRFVAFRHGVRDRLQPVQQLRENLLTRGLHD
jgi:hypothetical protein